LISESPKMRARNTAEAQRRGETANMTIFSVWRFRQNPTASQSTDVGVRGLLESTENH
jgi:hypothetical protein